MPGVLKEWPAWPEFGFSKPAQLSKSEECHFAAAKQAIIQEYGEVALTESWLKTCATLHSITDEIALKGSEIIPIIKLKDIEAGTVPDDVVESMKNTGCFIVRDVIDRDITNKLFADLKNYTSVNKGQYTGWPTDNPSIFNLYNTPTQNALRTDPNLLKLLRWINELWHWSEESSDVSADPLIYADAVRVRPGGSPFLGLGPHIDAGSLCRWADPQYRNAYKAIFSGKPSEHDCFDLDVRKNAVQDLFPGDAHSTVLRAFQGWTALTRTAPREGTILLYPNIKTAISYMLLRPFFKMPSDPSKVMDASQWQFDPDSSWFPGTVTDSSQRLSDSSHPHLRLKDCLVHVPELQAGDTVWWHTDVSSYSHINALLSK